MIRLWGKLIRPLIDAVNGKTIMEIGAEAGTSTDVLLRYVHKKGGRLYCIDPVPAFDADELQRKHPDHLVFYRDLSLNILPGHEPFDIALVDGDHNWYTVYHELKVIEEIHGHDPLRQPLIFVHDIAWPYARRDLYYDPATIPGEYIHPYACKGILPGKSELSEFGGMNIDICNACHEGGERNGVLTGVEDYLKESTLDYEFIRFPLYFGLGFLVTRERLNSNSTLQKQIVRLTGEEGTRELVKLAEHLRCVDVMYGQSAYRQLLAAQKRIVELEQTLERTGVSAEG